MEWLFQPRYVAEESGFCFASFCADVSELERDTSQPNSTFCHQNVKKEAILEKPQVLDTRKVQSGTSS